MRTKLSQLKRMMHHVKGKGALEYWHYHIGHQDGWEKAVDIILDVDPPSLQLMDANGSENITVEAAIQYIKGSILERL